MSIKNIHDESFSMAIPTKNPILGTSDRDTLAELSLRYLTRHGLIAGSTGTGKSRAMQVIAEQLADLGTNVFVSDVKGDASGFCVQGSTNLNSERNKLAPSKQHSVSANYWSVGNRFIPLRFSVEKVGPILISKLLSLNPTQESHLILTFSYAKKTGKKIHTLEQVLDILEEMLKTNQRGISKSSISVIERNIITTKESGLGELFGHPNIDISDLNGMNVLNLSNVRKNMSVSIAPAFLLQILFDRLPEVGDVETPRFALFFDEAHYLFKDANKSLRNLMVTILKQIRSKGVAVFFVTQDVTDIPDEILSQLSTKIIFSQKVFTQKGNRKLKALANSFPKSKIDLMEKLKTMPPGYAITSTLDTTGNQTAPVEVKIFAPATSMEVIADNTLLTSTNQELLKKYSGKNMENTRMKTEKKKTSNIGIVEKKLVIMKNGKRSSIWDTIFKFLLMLLDFILKASGRIFSFIIFKPAKAYFKWMMKKKIRIIYTIIFLLFIYIAIVNWQEIELILQMLRYNKG